MEGPDNLKGKTPKNPDDWSELEKDPKFQELFLLALQCRVMDKKFGLDVMEDYTARTITNSEDNDDKTINTLNEFEEAIIRAQRNPRPLIPEIDKLEEELEGLESVAEILAVAKREKVELTEEDINSVKESALRLFIEEKDNNS